MLYSYQGVRDLLEFFFVVIPLCSMIKYMYCRVLLSSCVCTLTCS